ncbi:hypothetical protein M404DRAFT_35242 [Pisolithus tinctorius Marx 270]|uniref:Uncharacterized protein n=1 Tax=Pisolithus tinctorius Marx 270 TaxID=870435 RepID=A0A0C3J9A1_PISTI|nr:hypothetical protein M404DRAFT_35242 [Pisolithus tinctorius Marx 270]
MSFLPSPNHLLGADLWTEDLQRIIHSRASVQDLQQWQSFPTSLCHMVEWATVARDPTSTDRRRSHLLVYKTLPIPEPYGVLYPVSVRIYGFLDKFCVGDFGNWNGDCVRAAYAVQSLSLCSAGNATAWRNQLDRLNLAASFASRVLKLPLPSIQFRSHLHMQRRVFTKRPIEAQPPIARDVPVVRNVTAQNANIPKLPDHPWEWNGPVEILERSEDGTITPIHEVLLSRGDFVEVDAEFDLVVVRTQASKSHLRVFLTCKQVLRLQTARIPTEAPSSSLRPTEVRRMRVIRTTEEVSSPWPPESTMEEPDATSMSLRGRRHSSASMPSSFAM